MGQDSILKRSNSTTQYLIIITLAFFTRFSVKNKRWTADIQRETVFSQNQFFHGGDNTNYRLLFRVGFQGSHFREGSELLKTRKEVLVDSTTNSPSVTGSLSKWHRPKANLQAT